MNLIKINTDHYVVVDDSEIKAGDVVAEKLITGEYELFEIHNTNDIDSSSQKVITHSTQPLSEECKTCTGYCEQCVDKWEYIGKIKMDIGFLGNLTLSATGSNPVGGTNNN